MAKKFYRVENDLIDFEVEYSTNDIYYGRNIDFKNYIHFLEIYFHVMKTENIPADFLIYMNNYICDFGETYVNVLRNAIVDEEYVDLYLISRDINHQNHRLPISSINTFIQNFDDEHQFYPFMNGIMLWEFMLETIRFNFHNEKPERLKSIFLFDNIQSCEYYIENHLGGHGQIYEVELLETENMFEADMRIIDNIQNHILFQDLIQELNDYWNGELTPEPITEVIFKGKYKYKNIT